MIIIAVIRLSAVHIEVVHMNTGPVRTVDFVWVIFWLHVEACTAVIMVSFSSFRSVFVAHESRLRDQDRKRRWNMSRKNLMASMWRRRKLEPGSENRDKLPAVPGATLTGMSTFISREKPLDHVTVSDVEVISKLANDSNAEMT